MSRMQPHSSVAGASYDLIGNNASPKFANATPATQLGGTVATLGSMGLLTAGSFVYGIMKKRPQELQLGYVVAGLAGTLPVAYDLWLNGGKKYGGLTNEGLILTYTSLVAPPLIGLFAGSVLGNYVASGSPKPSSRKQPWYQGRFAASKRSDYSVGRQPKKLSDERREAQKRQNERRKKGRQKKRKGRKKGGSPKDFDFADFY